MKDTKGITLLILIITVIVLLILTGVTIGTLTNNNRNINLAQNQIDKTNNLIEEGEGIIGSITGQIISGESSTSLTEEIIGNLSIEISETSTPANGEGYGVGETIEYEVKLRNDGNITIYDINVTSELTNDSWPIASLEPGEEVVVEPSPSYVVTEYDILAGEVALSINVEGTSPDPDNPEIEATACAISPISNNTSCILTIHYVFEDETTAFSDFVRTYNYGETYNVKSPAMEGYTPDVDRYSGTITENTTRTVTYTANKYTLTIYYRYSNGGIAAPTYTHAYAGGETYSVPSPEIPGYRCMTPVASGTMPSGNHEIPVYYVLMDTDIIIEDYDTPLT